METIRATVEEVDGHYFIRIVLDVESLMIPISQDRPNDVKSAFNKLIVRIKKGCFRIELGAVGEDLLSQVSSEYINQLNREILEVHGELQEFGLLCRS